MEHLLWQSTTRPIRYFLIPVETEVFGGGFEIESSDGDKHSVDLDAILSFEISEEKADEMMDQELQALLSEFGSVLKGLGRVGKKMFDKELNEDDSDEDDSDFDSDEDDSDFDSDEDDSDFDSDYDSDEDYSDYDSDEDDSDFDSDEEADLETLLTEFLSELEGPLQELGQTITKELGGLMEEFEGMGDTLGEEINTSDGKSFLRELGQKLIELADTPDSEEDEEEDMVVLQFEADSIVKEEAEKLDNDGDVVALFEEEEVETSETTETDLETVKVDDTSIKEVETMGDQNIETTETTKTEEHSEAIEIPSASILSKMKKVELLDLASQLGLDCNNKYTKKEIMESIEACR